VGRCYRCRRLSTEPSELLLEVSIANAARWARPEAGAGLTTWPRNCVAPADNVMIRLRPVMSDRASTVKRPGNRSSSEGRS